MATHTLLLFFALSPVLLLSNPSQATTSATAKCNADDKKALLAIKSFWGNPSALSSWDPATPCCAWDLVACTAGRITSLSISSDPNFSGSTIPPTVGDLPFLQYLVLSGLPNLGGSIPSTLARLTRLSWISLSNNRLSGPIPAFLGLLPKLKVLALDNNRFTGSIPDILGNLRPGFALDLNNNSLTGPLPRSMHAVNFALLDLAGNKLSGDASSLFRRSKTNVSYDHRFDLSRNRFEFDLTSAYFPRNMYWLYISRNRIYGSIPRQIVEATKLWQLDVSYNRLCGEIPTGGPMIGIGHWSYEHNRCLCGTPLPPCK